MFFFDKILNNILLLLLSGTVLIDLLFSYMNRQFSYNNFDSKYMHKSQLLLLIYLFLCG